MKKRLFTLILAALLAVSPALAQVDTPTPDLATVEPTATITPTPVIVEEPPPNPIPDDEPGELPVTTPETLLGQFYSLLKDGTYITWAAAGTVIVVGVIKVLLGAAGISLTGSAAVTVALAVQMVIWIGYAIANYLNQGEAFKIGYLAIVDVARSLLPLFGAIGLGHEAYQFAHRRNWPVVGYSKPEEPNPFRGNVTRTKTMSKYPPPPNPPGSPG